DGSLVAGGTGDAFFKNGGARHDAPDEEGALRAREHEAERALKDIGPLLEPNERITALQRVRNQYPGTEAARAAAGGLAAVAGAPARGPSREALSAALDELRARLRGPSESGAPLLELLRQVDDYRPAPEVATGFEPLRATLASELVEAAAAHARE